MGQNDTKSSGQNDTILIDILCASPIILILGGFLYAIAAVTFTLFS